MNLSIHLPIRIKYSLYLLLFLSLQFIYSQPFKNITISEGLPGNSIKCIFKDSNGLMWIATETGLCTYDGLNYEIIGEEKGLKYNLIWKIIEDDKKNLWFSVYGNGVAKYDGKTFTYFDKTNGLINDAVRSLYFSKKYNCMVFGTEDGLSLFDGKKFKNFNFEINNPTKKFQVNFITEYEDKILFGVNHDFIFELQINSKQIQKSIVKKYLFAETKNYSGFINGNNFYSHAYSNEFEVYDLKTHKKTFYGNCPVIWEYTTDNQNNIYATCWDVNAPRGALLCLKNNKLVNLSEKLQFPTSLFWCLYFDKLTNQLWVGSIDKGIFVIDLSQKISYINKDANFINDEINTIYIDDNDGLWLGGNNFISFKNKEKTKKLTNENLTSQLVAILNKKKEKDSIYLKSYIKESKNYICYSIRKDTQGSIWALTNYGLLKIDKNLKINNFVYIQDTGGVMDFIDDNQIYLSQNYQYSYLIPVSDLSKYQKIIYKNKPFSYRVINVSKGNEGLWIATYTNGLFLLENGIMKSMKDLGYLGDNNMNEVFVDSHNNIISGTLSGKVYISQWEKNRLKHIKILYPDKDIIGNSIFFIREYNGYYLIGTNKGLNIIRDFKLYKFINQAENFNQTIYTDAEIDINNDKLVITSKNGLITVDLNKIFKNEKVNSPIQITSIKVNDRKIEFSKDLQLNYNENNIELSFKSNNTYNASKNRFRYKIIGLRDKWTSYTSQNNIKLIGLNSGNYQIIIEGKNIGTNEQIAPIELNLYINPPFWETGWFISFTILLFGLLFVVYFKRKIIRIRKKAELEKRIAETKLLALQSQMNPHFVFNAMNSIQNFVIDNNTDDALWYIGEFSKLMRQTLNYSSKTTINLEEEVDYLKRYIILENFRRKIKVKWVIDINDTIDVHDIEIPPMIIQPLVENVFVHAFVNSITNPELRINFSKYKNKIICLVTDNGMGVDDSNTFSKGLKLVEERIQLSDSTSNNRISFIKVLKGTSIKIEISIR